MPLLRPSYLFRLCGCMLPNIEQWGVQALMEAKSMSTAASQYQLKHPGCKVEPWTELTHKERLPEWIAYNPRTMRPPPLSSNTRALKIVSWNVNGLKTLLASEGFSALELARREDFDVLCLQETHLEVEPIFVRYGLGELEHDKEGRLITLEFDDFYLLNAYVPNSGRGLGRLNYRVKRWDRCFGKYIEKLEKSKPVIVAGDLNCAHHSIDIHHPAANYRKAGFTIEERRSFKINFSRRGLVDTFRKRYPNAVAYTFWGEGQRMYNKGWRLDYFLASESIANKVHDSYILPDISFSDRSPIGLVLKL